MAGIVFRLARSEDVLEPYYVRIVDATSEQPLAFSENDASEEAGTRAITALRSGLVTHDVLHDQSNGVWLFRLRTPEGEALFRSLPCPTEASALAVIDEIVSSAPAATVVDDRPGA